MAGFLYHIRHGDLQVSRNGSIGRRRERFREVSRTMMMTTRRKAFFISHVPPAHYFFEKRSILESILLILFSCSSMAGFLYHIRHGDLQVSRNGSIGRRRERFREVSRTMMMTTRRKAFFISHVPPAHYFFEKRSILESILLILFSCSSMAGFLYHIRHGDLQVSRNGSIGRRRERFREVSRTMMMTTRRKA